VQISVQGAFQVHGLRILVGNRLIFLFFRRVDDLVVIVLWRK
jgi:hypothetical protein